MPVPTPLCAEIRPERLRQPEIARNNLHPMDWTEWWRMSSVSGIFILVEEP